MFIEYKDGEKHTGKIDRAELSENITTFNSCGELIADNEVVIDIDHLPKESIKAMIQEFGIKTQVVWTERGAHLWFKKPVWFTRRHDGVCKLGFEIEQHTMQSNPGGMTVRRNGVTRDIDNIGLRAYMPDIFQVGTKKKPYQNLTGMDDGDGRNKALFAQRKALNNCQDWEKMLGFINKHVFATPLTDDEFGTILRDISEDSETDDKYWIASDIIQKCHTVLYSGMIWWMKDGQYIADADNKRLIRRVYEMCEGQTTRYVDEVVKQIEYRSMIVDADTVFPIKFNNGVLQEGMFIPMKDYTDFTPFMIDVDYKEDAAPVQEVDDYIDSLTSKDPDYRKLLMEVIGFVMITDPERIRKQTVRWMPMDKWDACAFPVDADYLRGRVCYGGLDLSSTSDITAFVLVFPPDDPETGKYEILPYFWLPEETLPIRVKRDHVLYDVWQRQGYINTTEGQYVDHIDGDPTNNRRQNLRLATPLENQRNMSIAKNNTSGFKGVSYRKDRGKYRAYISLYDRYVHLGHYDTAVEAARAYDQAARFYFGDFACLNFPYEHEQDCNRKVILSA